MNSESGDHTTPVSLSPLVFPLRTVDSPENWATLYIIAGSILGAVLVIFFIFLAVKYAKSRIGRRPIEPPKRPQEFLNFERDYARMLGSFNDIYDSNYHQTGKKIAETSSRGFKKVVQQDKFVESGSVDDRDENRPFPKNSFSSDIATSSPSMSNSSPGPQFYPPGMTCYVNGQPQHTISPPFLLPHPPSNLLRHPVLDTLDDIAPYVPTPTKCRSLIDEPWSTSDNGDSTKSTLIRQKERMTNPELCYEMCCTGLAKVTLFITLIILMGIVVGVILGLSVD
uniref:Uncharacterized protein n=1 Tax=Romanomermis culicivorax TaxID=13658 RepID=A0A915HHL2_ROMCU